MLADLPERVDGRRLPSAKWERISRRAGVARDDDWEPRLSALADHDRDGHAATELATFVRDLRDDLGPADRRATWAESASARSTASRSPSSQSKHRFPGASSWTGATLAAVARSGSITAGSTSYSSSELALRTRATRPSNDSTRTIARVVWSSPVSTSYDHALPSRNGNKSRGVSCARVAGVVRWDAQANARDAQANAIKVLDRRTAIRGERSSSDVGSRRIFALCCSPVRMKV